MSKKYLQNMFLFLGEDSSIWDPKLRQVTKNFMNNKIFYDVSSGLKKLNLVLNLLFNTMVLKQSILLVDPEKKCYNLVYTFNTILKKNKVFYVSELSDGFFTNNTFSYRRSKTTPAVAVFFSVNKSIPLIIDLKKSGTITVGFVSKYTKNLDFSVFTSRYNSEFCYLVVVFLVFVIKKGLGKVQFKKFLDETN